MAGSNTGPGGIPPGGPWFLFPPTGTIQRQSNPLLAEGLVAAGWFGYATQADAKAAAAEFAKLRGAAIGAVTGVVTTPADFLSRLTDPSTWLRVAEVVLGLVLIAVGLAKLTNAVPVATKVAKGAMKVGEVAALL